MKKYNVAIVGIRGVVGDCMFEILKERKFPVNELRLLSFNPEEANRTYEINGKEFKLSKLTPDAFENIDIGLFSPGAAISKEYAPYAVKAGCVVIDNTSQFRMEPDVPLVVPEVNPKAIAQYKKRNIIANPNCSTIQMVVALKPIHDAVRIKRIVVSTYQAVSGAGKEAMDELSDQVLAIYGQKEIKKKVFPYQIAFNCIPQIDLFLDNGYTKEEMKMVNETRKIMGDNSIKVTATTVRVPVFRCHSESLNIETEKKISPNEIRAALSKAPGIVVFDVPEKNVYPIPVDVAGKDDTYAGRIREDESIENGINMWIVADNLRKGAALNAVQIAEKLIEMAN